jgi:DNA-binding Xre family transcriptional regulator
MSATALTPTQVKRFKRSAHVALLDRDQSITELARKLRIPRSTVSKAINQGRFPNVRTEISKALSL